MKRLGLLMAALAWLASGCATYSERYGDYDYADDEGYYVVDEVVYGGQTSYYGGVGIGHDPYWRYSGFNYYPDWPSYYVFSPYYDPFYVSTFGYGPSAYYGPYRPYGGVSFFGYYGSYADPWYFGHRHYGYYDHRDRRGRYVDRGGARHRVVGRGDRGQRYRGRGRDPGLTARNEARRLTTTPQPVFRAPPKASQKPRNGGRDSSPRKAPGNASRQNGGAPRAAVPARSRAPARGASRPRASSGFGSDYRSLGSTAARAAVPRSPSQRSARSTPARPAVSSRNAPRSSAAIGVPTRAASPRASSAASSATRVVRGSAGSRIPVVDRSATQRASASVVRSPPPAVRSVPQPSRAAAVPRSVPAPSRGVAPRSVPRPAAMPRSAPSRGAGLPSGAARAGKGDSDRRGGRGKR